MEEINNPAAALTVSNVMSAYARRMDKHDLDGLLELLHEDCAIDYGDFGYYDGKEEVTEFLEGYIEGETGIVDSIHLTANPYIETDGDTAMGRWHYLGLDTLEDMGAVWLVGFYTVEFSREEGDWLITELTYDAKYFSPYDEGWAEKPMAI